MAHASNVDVRAAVLPLLSFALACGKRAEHSPFATPDASGDAAVGQVGGEDEAGGPIDEAADDAFPSDAPPPITCTVTNWAARTGTATCHLSVSEACTDGDAYTVSCDCPAATCSCTHGRDGGLVFATFSFADCASCADAGAAPLFAGCGVPY